jgi:hypothetical protein
MTPHDDTPRIIKIGDALTQLFNVGVLPNHTDTDANESTSGRAHRRGWRAEKLIDAVFSLFGDKGHCRGAHLKDAERARRTLNHERHTNG